MKCFRNQWSTIEVNEKCKINQWHATEINKLHQKSIILVWSGMVLFDIVWYGMVWQGMVWYCVVWHGMVWYGVVRYGMVWYGMVWYGMVWYDMVWYAMLCYAMVWAGMVWYGMVYVCIVDMYLLAYARLRPTPSRGSRRKERIRNVRFSLGRKVLRLCSSESHREINSCVSRALKQNKFLFGSRGGVLLTLFFY